MESYNASTMMGGLSHIGPNTSSRQFLPQISYNLETIRLTYGALLRLCLHSSAYYGCRGFVAECVLGRKGAKELSEREVMRYVLSMSGEIGVSVLIMPVRYLAASTTPRFILDYMFTRWSDFLAVVDLFNPGAYASYALYAFGSSDAEWNFDFFTWQVPSVILTLGKLILRRRRVGAAQCRTKRVVGMLLVQILLRAYMSTFSVMIPEQGSEAVEAMVVTVLEGMATSYLARHTWPFPWEGLKPVSSSSTTDFSAALTPEAVDTP
ncbi:hypothetical protein ABL78_6849 [Leptomonas seymouri]|uniref:Uncharacterized protein n=1 Tax=Leptomonas seymouri TaxID=5684 RepID=A0A0N1PBK1_LEPSE|nr:hypothetical protein ABL78_6849 [Leptomonas seymouri]|eukprot:KPI84093.1 hypothetical protein ABL78_6849 [Leptomonas seymouri]